MVHIIRARHRRPGIAAVELAVLAPLIMMLLLGVWEVGRLLDVNQILSNAAREGARQAATGQLSSAQVQTVVVDYLQNEGIPTSSAVVTVNDLTNPGTDPAAAAQMDHLQVTVTIPFRDVRWSTLTLVTTSTSTLTGQATWFSLKDQTFPTTVTVPPGS